MKLTTYCINEDCLREMDLDIPDCRDCNNSTHGCDGCSLRRYEALEDAVCIFCFNTENPGFELEPRTRLS